MTQKDRDVVEEVLKKYTSEYLEYFEKVEIKAALKTAMELSSICNKYMQDEKPWEAENTKSGRYSYIFVQLLKKKLDPRLFSLFLLV